MLWEEKWDFDKFGLLEVTMVLAFCIYVYACRGGGGGGVVLNTFRVFGGAMELISSYDVTDFVRL